VTARTPSLARAAPSRSRLRSARHRCRAVFGADHARDRAALIEAGMSLFAEQDSTAPVSMRFANAPDSPAARSTCTLPIASVPRGGDGSRRCARARRAARDDGAADSTHRTALRGRHRDRKLPSRPGGSVRFHQLLDACDGCPSCESATSVSSTRAAAARRGARWRCAAGRIRRDVTPRRSRRC